MKILIIGGSRFIGRAIAEQARQAGHQVILFNRGQSWPEAPFEQVQGHLDDLPQFQDLITELDPDAIVHCIAYTPTDAQNFVNTVRLLDAHSIVLSSEDCYEAFQGLNRGEELSDFPINEDSPTAQEHFYWRDLGIKKMADYDKNIVTERVLEGLEQCTVFRLPMVYGPRDLQFAHRHGAIIRRIYDQQALFALGMGQQQGLWHFGYIDNIAAAVIHALKRPETYGQIYNLGEAQMRSWRRWIQLYSEISGHAFEIRLLPDTWLSEDAEPNAPPKHFLAETRRYRETTGFVEPVSLNEAIQATLNWGLDYPEILGDPPDYSKEAKLIEAWQKYLRGPA